MRKELKVLARNFREGLDTIDNLLLATGGQATLLSGNNHVLEACIDDAITYSNRSLILLDHINTETSMKKPVKKRTRKKQ